MWIPGKLIFFSFDGRYEEHVRNVSLMIWFVYQLHDPAQLYVFVTVAPWGGAKSWLYILLPFSKPFIFF